MFRQCKPFQEVAVLIRMQEVTVARPRLAFNARVGEINMVNPREVIGIYTQCAGKSGSATVFGLSVP